MCIGFLGLGTMGTPMALNLAREFFITVWNCNLSKYPYLIAYAGNQRWAQPRLRLVRDLDVIFMMLFDAIAISDVLVDLKIPLAGKTHYLAKEVSQVGGRFVEMPVSGSKLPAEKGQLVAMLAGDADVAEEIRPVTKPIASAAVYCGPIGYGLRTKYAANLYLITLTVGLAESMNLARAQGLDLAILEEVLSVGPMASVYARNKMAKAISGDWSPQAAIKDCHNSSKLICAEADASTATKAGFGEDMIAVIKILSQSKPN
ncbi:hypothetical protein GGS24DRAFT_512849 [Hypoxylon argillaceum]|nr:hypothetical protein GGS24DRAFT_512849 [Hypoxylon argillaceum]